jgi:hypothetical protein
VRCPATNKTEGERNVQSNSCSPRSTFRKSRPKRLRFVFRRERWRVNKPHAWCHLQAAGAADHEQSLHARLLYSGDQGSRVRHHEPDGADDCIVTGEKLGEAALVVNVTLPCG